MASYNGPPGGDSSNQSIQAMLARLQHNRQSGQISQTGQEKELLSRFSSFTSQGTPEHQGNQGNQAFHNFSVDSPAMTPSDIFPPPAPTPPSANFPNAQHPPGMMGHHGSSAHAGNNNPEHSMNLLNLLKFSGGGQGSQSGMSGSEPSPSALVQAFPNLPNPTIQPRIHAPAPAAADPSGLLAALMKGQHNEPARSDHQVAPNSNSWNSGAPPADTQQYLLNLLNRPKPAQNDQPPSESSQQVALTPQSGKDSLSDNYQLKQILAGAASEDRTPHPPIPSNNFDYDARSYGSPRSKAESGASPAQNGSSRQGGMFSYSNPFEDLAASSPRNKTSKSSTPNGQAPAAPGIQILKKPLSHTSSPPTVPEHNRPVTGIIGSERGTRRLEQPSSLDTDPVLVSHTTNTTESFVSVKASEEHKETVAEAVGGIAERADHEAQDALRRAEQEEAQARIARDIDIMNHARTEEEFQESAEIAAKDIKNELEKQENAGILEQTLSPEVAEAVRDIIEETAQGPVADSWESAEADEIVVIEEASSPIPVYNFPMKPWISITLLENSSVTRPLFKDESLLDIARLKKDFDQIDRNLITASENYMVYGMSKAGGLRVIRQDDGADAKLFTDTKDRIFNVAMSATRPESLSTPTETIIGTGVSGTVYYVRIKNGDKDHLDDPNPEQYGFALPPTSTQEGGDAPGGVLKTRARTSASNPDYFAVGRGKTINIIWPGYIMQNNLFKAGHDRVVDTEKLYKQCSLKINTGKAGKDFTFSPDDTTIVSLDKSGRVKFWDVRDLTTADQYSEPRNVLPVNTSLEIKEPLMTLTTTPEGEKAWPTSVLLLDKQRPYQKRCALRYMIIGMKQNHTLQLWDLALGKPVQEFNLPHSKESDAVCSVMYHPPSGMVVVGHPTRNSIYFLHLSAPKYTIKGLSQVDYIQKLVAKDASIPEPDSTAVISGIREYSFANKGILRSLDILANPAAAPEGDEQTLFELYSMHSKGVTAIFVKQPELGWTKDNKVASPVDAIDAGVVKLNKLKELPTTQSVEPNQTGDEGASMPIRLASRPPKETPQTTVPAQDFASRKAAESLTPAATKAKESNEEAAHTTPAPEKSEKKSRKKREKAAQAAEKAAAGNAASQSPNVEPSKNEDPIKSLQTPLLAESVQSVISQLESSLNKSLSTVIDKALKESQKKIDAGFANRDAAFHAHQQNLLKMVSTALNDNVQSVLTKIVADQFEESVIPNLTKSTTKSVADSMGQKINSHISNSVQKEMQKSLPNALSQALQKPELARLISDKVVANVSQQVDQQFIQTMSKTVIPQFTNLAGQAAQRVGQDIHQQAMAQIGELERLRHADQNKIDQLIGMVNRLTDTVSAMASTQTQLQAEVHRLQQRDRHVSSQSVASHPSQGPSYNSPNLSATNQLVPYPGPAAQPQPQKDAELERYIGEIATYFEDNDYETALIRWLQCPRKDEVFAKYLARVNPAFLRELSALVSLSVGAVLTTDLEGPEVKEKVAWMEYIIHSLHSALPHIDSAVHDVIPNIMSTYLNRIEHLFTRVNQVAPGDPILKNLSQMRHMARDIINAASAPAY